MRERGVDRRHYGRFEIVGTFVGSLETWRRLEVHNLGSGGALVETDQPCAPDTTVRGRVSFRGSRRDVRFTVRHVHEKTAVDGRRAYGLGLEFPEGFSDRGGLVSESASIVRDPEWAVTERRRHRRMDAPEGLEIEFSWWTTVMLADVSLGGAMFVGTVPLPLRVGDPARFRARFGDRSFDAEVQIRRIVLDSSPNARHGVGAEFTSISHESRDALTDFLRDGMAES